MNKKILNDILFKEQNIIIKKRLKNAKSSIYLNMGKSLSLSNNKEKEKNKVKGKIYNNNNINKSKYLYYNCFLIINRKKPYY